MIAQSNLNLQAMLFYKRTNGLLETDTILNSPESIDAEDADYNVLVNRGEVTSKGIELNVEYSNKISLLG